MEIPFLFPRFAYTEIDLMMFIPTFILSLTIRRDYISLVKAIMVVSPLYLFWDFLATWKDSWSFNPKYVLGIYIINLPIEEVLFFVVTPFATLFIYDYFRYKRMFEKEVKKIPKISLLVGIVSFIISPLFISHSYTFVDFLYLGMALTVAYLLNREMLSSLTFWIFILTSYIPFLVFDFFLTALPVVEYGFNSTLGIRIITIPIEDFIYSFSMLTLYTAFYTRGGNTIEGRN